VRGGTGGGRRGRRFLRVMDTAVWCHEEQASIALPAGSYEIIRQREYQFAEVHNVID
jgi:hypothetical protein